MAGRIQLEYHFRSALAHEHFENARRLAPDLHLTHAAWGDFYRVQEEDEAQQHYETAVENGMRHNQPDAVIAGYLGLGLLNERAKDWVNAARDYDSAVDLVRDHPDLMARFTYLAAPANGNVFLQAAYALGRRSPELALKVVDRALTLNLQDGTDYPNRTAYRLKGEILADLNHSSEAAEALALAARRYGWLEHYDVAIELFEHAIRLNPQDATLHWFLSDHYLRKAFAPKPTDQEFATHKAECDAFHQRGVASYQAGIALQAPDAEYAWVFTLRAQLLEYENRYNNPTDKGRNLWEGVIAQERSIALKDDEPYAWITLARVYGELSLDATGLHAARRAFELAPDDEWVLEQNIISLTNYGRFSEASELLEQLHTTYTDRRETGEWDQAKLDEWKGWAEGIRAYISLYTGTAEATRQHLDQALQLRDDWEEPGWFYDVRAVNYALMQDWDAFFKHHTEQWNKRDEPEIAVRSLNHAFGWSAYIIGEAEAALEQGYKALEQNTDDHWGSRLRLGQYLLALNRIDEADEMVRQTLQAATNPRQLQDFARFDVMLSHHLVERQAWKHHEQASNLLNQWRDLAHAQVESLLSAPRPPLDELMNPPIRSESLEYTVGCLAVQGRLAREANHFDRALQAYHDLLAYPEHFPEAMQKVNEIRALIQTQVVSSDYATALANLRALLAYPSDDLPGAAATRFQIALIEAAQSEDAVPRLHEALAQINALDAEGTTISAQIMSHAFSSIIKDVATYWKIHDDLINPTPTDADAITLSARHTLTSTLGDLLQVNHSADLPLLTPIMVELGSLLISDEMRVNQGSVFEIYVPQLRDAIRERFGLVLPGVRFREMLTTEQYIVMFDDIPLAHGHVEASRRFTPTDASVLRESLHDFNMHLIEAVNPLNGRGGCWVLQADWERTEAAGFSLWQEAVVYVMRHLEAVIMQKLDRFVTLDTWQTSILPEWEKLSAIEAQVQRLLTTPRAVVLLCRVLRDLVREQVPLKQGDIIMDALLETGLAQRQAAVQAVRAALKAHLPGNEPDRVRLRVPDEWASKLFKTDGAGAVRCAPTPENAHEFERALRKWLARPHELALVIAQSDQRPLLRQYISAEFPYVPVLSVDEVLDQGTVENVS